MLDIMRRHASSWLIRGALGIIIIVFIFFFGYSSYTKGAKGGRAGTSGGVAAEVNGFPISSSEFEFFFDRNMEQMKSSFEGKELPDFARKMAESSTLRQLIFREAALQEADELGLTIPDDELADLIRKAQTPKDGEFDPIAYRHNFLPYFKNRFGLDYEQFVRTDLVINTFEEIFDKVDETPVALPDPSDGTTWIFETVTIDPNALVESKAMASADEAKSLAEIISKSNPKEWKGLLKPLKIEPKRSEPLSLARRGALLDGNGTLDDYATLFSLKTGNPVISKPIERAEKIYIVRLVETKKAAGKDAEAGKTGNFFMEWMSKRTAGAKVRDFLNKDQEK